MKSKVISIWNVGAIFFLGLFLCIGLAYLWRGDLNMAGLYLALALLYIPGIEDALNRLLKLGIPRGLKYLIAILVLWGTLATGHFLHLFSN
jgi:hypothetical protein